MKKKIKSGLKTKNKQTTKHVKRGLLKKKSKRPSGCLGRRMAKQNSASRLVSSLLLPFFFASWSKRFHSTESDVFFGIPTQGSRRLASTEKPRAVDDDDISPGDSPERNRKWNSTPGARATPCWLTVARPSEAPRETGSEIKGPPSDVGAPHPHTRTHIWSYLHVSGSCRRNYTNFNVLAPSCVRLSPV